MLRESSTTVYVLQKEDPKVCVTNDHSRSWSRVMEKNTATKWLRSNWKRTLEVISVSCVVLVVWILFALPTVFYSLSPSPLLQNEKTDDELSDNGSYLYTELSSNTSDRETDIDSEIVCAEGFYPDNSSTDPLCLPLCNYWLSVSRSSVGVLVVEMISKVVSFVSSVIVFVLAFWLKRNTMLVLPTAYLVYMCLTLTAITPVVLLALVDKESVLCPSKNLLESLENETPFCTVTGIFHIYTLAQISSWILFHALGILRGIAFPFTYRKIKAEGKLKYIHISTVLIALILPLVPALLPLIDGYSVIPTSIGICVGRNIAITYFSLVLPFSILFAIASTVLIAVFWRLFKEFSIKQSSSGKPKGKTTIRTARAKILIIMCYYVIIGVVLMTGYTFFITNNDRTLESFKSYFSCHSVGVQLGIDCGEPPEDLFLILTSVSAILIGLFPVIILIYSADCIHCIVYHRGGKSNPETES